MINAKQDLSDLNGRLKDLALTKTETAWGETPDGIQQQKEALYTMEM